MRSYINIPVANMHREADSKSEMVSQAIYGTPITPLETHDKWCQIRTPDDYTGYILTEELLEATYEANDKVSSLGAFLYPTPSFKQPPSMQLPYGTPLQATHQQDWSEVTLIDGTTSFIRAKDFDKMGLEKFIGIPYLWGGTSSFGFDCSGFVQTVFSQLGLQLPRDAYQQIKSPLFETIDRPRCGSLLFFGDEKKVSHVGIALSEENFIHAAIETPDEKGPPGIRISGLATYRGSYLGAYHRVVCNDDRKLQNLFDGFR